MLAERQAEERRDSGQYTCQLAGSSLLDIITERSAQEQPETQSDTGDTQVEVEVKALLDALEAE